MVFSHGIDSGSLLTDSSADWTTKFSICRQILQRWKDKNIRTLGDVRLQDAQHQKRKLEKAVSKADKPKSAAPNRFNNFHQRDYDFAEYEKKLLNKPN